MNAERFTRRPHHRNRHAVRIAAPRNTRTTTGAIAATAPNTTDRGAWIHRIAATGILFFAVKGIAWALLTGWLLLR